VCGFAPTNEYRPMFSPPSTDSSRNDGPVLRIFWYAKTGVSASARISRYTGMRFPCCASFRNSVFEGVNMVCLLSF